MDEEGRVGVLAWVFWMAPFMPSAVLATGSYGRFYFRAPRPPVQGMVMRWCCALGCHFRTWNLCHHRNLWRRMPDYRCAGRRVSHYRGGALCRVMRHRPGWPAVMWCRSMTIEIAKVAVLALRKTISICILTSGR